MKIIDKHIWKAVIGGLIIAWLALLTLDFFFAFIDEVGSTNSKYNSVNALVYLSYTLPSKLYTFFPTAMLIGTLLGLGALAADSEFIAMQAAGVSRQRIISSATVLGGIVAVAVFFLAETAIPYFDHQATQYKAEIKSGKRLTAGQKNYWLKKNDHFILIDKATSARKLHGIHAYTVKNQQLVSIIDAKGAQRKALKKITTTTNDEAHAWHLINSRQLTFKGSQIDIIEEQQNTRMGSVLETPIGALNKPLQQLNSLQLIEQINYLDRNNLNSNRYELTLWKRFSTPLSALVMLLIAMPFLFSNQRSSGAGQKLFFGIVIGVVFFLFSRTINESGSIYGLPPIMSAFLPSVLLLSAAFYFLRRDV